MQFSREGESLAYCVIAGPTPKAAVQRLTELTGRAALPPAWSFGLWMTTSFTTQYDEATATHFIDEMARRELPLAVFHFDCFWMREFQWCDFQWDPRGFPDPEGMLARLHAKGLKISLWINPYVAQKSPLFAEGVREGYFLHRPDGRTWQTDLWQPGMAIVDFTNPAAVAWYQGHLRRLLALGVDCFKTDFGERIPSTGVVYHDGIRPGGDAQPLRAEVQRGGVRVAAAGQGRARPWCSRAATYASAASASPGALGRRLLVQLRIDGREPARRPVAHELRLCVLEPRHRRLRGQPAAGGVQALDPVRPAVLAQQAAWQQLATGCPGWWTKRAAPCCSASRG